MTEATFLAAILADPQDDGPRLAYADWLMERGDPRGEFVKVQIEIAGMECAKEWLRLQGSQHNNGPCRCGRCERVRRQNELLSEHLDEWVPACLDDAERTLAIFSRGFLSGIECSIPEWMQHGPAIVQSCPIERYRPVGVKPRYGSWWLSDIGGHWITRLHQEYLAGIRDPWERISRAAIKWAKEQGETK